MSDAALQKACQELVERGRLGDQNALATMSRVRKNAEKGDARAKKSHDMMLRFAKYTEDDRPGDAPKMGRDIQSALAALRDGMRRVKNPLEYVKHVRFNVPQVGFTIRDAANSAQAVSLGPEITQTAYDAVKSTFTTDSAKQAYQAAYDTVGNIQDLKKATGVADAQEKNALQMGFVMGLARRMQIVRKGGPIAAYSKLAAWELGCENGEDMLKANAA